MEELVGDKALTSIQSWSGESMCRDRDDKPEYRCKMSFALTFSNQISLTEYYHNSSWLEHGGSPEQAVKTPLSIRLIHI